MKTACLLASLATTLALAAKKSGYKDYGEKYRPNESVGQHYYKIHNNNDPEGQTSQFHTPQQLNEKKLKPQRCHIKDGRFNWQKGTI